MLIKVDRQYTLVTLQFIHLFLNRNNYVVLYSIPLFNFLPQNYQNKKTQSWGSESADHLLSLRLLKKNRIRSVLWVFAKMHRLIADFIFYSTYLHNESHANESHMVKNSDGTVNNSTSSTYVRGSYALEELKTIINIRV